MAVIRPEGDMHSSKACTCAMSFQLFEGVNHAVFSDFIPNEKGSYRERLLSLNFQGRAELYGIKLAMLNRVKSLRLGPWRTHLPSVFRSEFGDHSWRRGRLCYGELN